MSKRLLITESEAAQFAKALSIPYDKIKVKKNGAVIFKRNAEEFGAGFPSELISGYIIRNFTKKFGVQGEN